MPLRHHGKKKCDAIVTYDVTKAAPEKGRTEPEAERYGISERGNLK